MAYYITHANNNKNFQPMNANFGFVTYIRKRIKDKKERYETLANRALKHLDSFKVML